MNCFEHCMYDRKKLYVRNKLENLSLLKKKKTLGYAIVIEKLKHYMFNS